MKQLNHFLILAENDPRLGLSHICLYIALWKKWKDSNYAVPLRVYRSDMGRLSKIDSPGVYHKVIRQLSAYGYINYIPSYNRFAASEIYFTDYE